MDGIRQLWVIGGSAIYSHFLDATCDTPINQVWLTKIDSIYEADVFFPIEKFKYPSFTIVHKTKNGLKYEISCYD